MCSKNNAVITRHLTKLTGRMQRTYTASTVTAVWDGRSVILTGNAPTAEERRAIGSFFVKHCKRYQGYKGLVNDMTVAGEQEPPMRLPLIQDSLLERKNFDIVVIGAGVIGCAIARQLAQYRLSIAVLEKECDCAMQASSRNDGMIHPGFADKPESIKGKLNIRGNRLYRLLSRELDFQVKWPGSFMLFHSPLLKFLVPLMHRRAVKNGVDGKIGYKNKKTINRMEPNLSTKHARHYGGFWMPSAGIASPFKVTAAFAENAADNGVRFFFDTAVTGFDCTGSRITAIRTNRGVLSAALVINAAGVWSDTVAGFADDRFFSIHPRKGIDLILDKKKSGVQQTIVGMPRLLSSAKKRSKGGGIVPCIEGNILIGPTAKEVYDREDYSTDSGDIKELLDQLAMNTKLSAADIIAYYGGIRAANWEEDFIVEGSEKRDNLIHAAAIQSPGFAAAPAIAEAITEIALERQRTLTGTKPEKNPVYTPYRTAAPELAALSFTEKNELIKKNPQYGAIVCRCEHISEGEIRDAVRSCIKIGITNVSVDAVKRRCRAGAGRCHGGFCTPRVMEIIAEETGFPLEKITKKGGNSFIIVQPLTQPAEEAHA